MPTKSKKTKKSVKNQAAESQVAEPLKPPANGSKPSTGEMRRHLDERLRALYQRAMIIERELQQLDRKFYRVCIFGSARMKPESPIYQDAFTIARYLSWEGIDVLTGGGPGLMEAANRGAQLGRQEKRTKSLSYGLSIQLEFEPMPNLHLDVKRHHHKFSSRLDDFMRLSHSIVVTPGGIGTVLEMMFAWQLMQVKHIEPRPIVLLHKEFWSGFLEWMKAQPLERGLMSAKDFNVISVVDTPEEVAEIISEHHKKFVAERAREAGKSAS